MKTELSKWAACVVTITAWMFMGGVAQALVNGAFDAGEAIYLDNDVSGTVTAGDTLIQGPAQALGTPLIGFAALEVHTEDWPVPALSPWGIVLFAGILMSAVTIIRLSMRRRQRKES